VGFP